ncbi:MAG: hypothetical protein J6M53_03720 [Bacteroidaceae bacterium]|nr:hypothetical protein [Bacteroidaceae bacterium]
MAKKTIGREMTVEQKLEALFKLQTILSQIDEIRTLRGELPLEVQDLEDEIEGLTTRIGKLNDESETLKGDIAVMRGQIAEAQALVERYNEQLNDVKNNREYDMLNKEIEYQNLDIQLQEKRIREAEAGIKERSETLVESRQTLDDRRADLDVKKAELDEIVAETRAEEEKLREKANTLEMTIEPRLLTSFKRIRRNSRNGLGIVYVQRDACGGCFNKIPPQRQLDIRMRKKIIVCEYCGRIMIDPELAGVKIEKPVEKPKRKRPSRAKKTEE